MIVPPTLKEGSTIAIVSPASRIDPELVAGACRRIEREGFVPLVMPHALGVSGSYSAPAAERLADLQAAIDNRAVGAILCSRGGYGAAHLLDGIDLHRPVWIIGFSDVSALHALWHSRGYCSIHASMAKELTLNRCKDDDANRRLFEILRTGRMPAMEFESGVGSRPGMVTAPIAGGNLAVLEGLAETPYELIRPGSILVVEDVAEPIYKVERIFWRLRMAGILRGLRGLVVGQFTGWKPSADWPEMDTMLAQFAPDIDGPVAFGAPVGHIDGNLPFVEGAEVTLRVTPQKAVISQIY